MQSSPTLSLQVKVKGLMIFGVALGVADTLKPFKQNTPQTLSELVTGKTNLCKVVGCRVATPFCWIVHLHRRVPPRLQAI